MTERLTSIILLFHKFKNCNSLILEEYIILSIPWSRKQLISEENWYHVRIIVPCSETFIDTTFAPWPQLSKDVSAYSLLGTYKRKGTWLLAQVILPWVTKTSNMIIAICFDRCYGPKLNITKPFQYKLVSKKKCHVYDLTLHINEHRCWFISTSVVCNASVLSTLISSDANDSQ